jgi:GT2 family glycosyltransferase
MTDKPIVYTICGVHNGLNYTKELLASIKKQSYPNIIIIFIDDGSTDGTSDFIKRNYPEIILLKGDGNLWWTGALYKGVKKVLSLASKDDFIFTVNNDCIFGRDLVLNLVKTSLGNHRAIVGSLIIDSNNVSKIIDAGVQIDWPKGKYISLLPKKITDLPKNKLFQENIDTLSTKGTLYPVEVFHKIGNFDKKHLPHYVSDYEFACRAKKAGFTLLLSYQARVYNDAGRTGFGETIPSEINFKQFRSLLFSRNSRINIVDHFWFTHLCCPLKYKPISYFRLLAKCLYLFIFIFPFNLIRNKLLK